MAESRADAKEDAVVSGLRRGEERKAFMEGFEIIGEYGPWVLVVTSNNKGQLAVSSPEAYREASYFPPMQPIFRPCAVDKIADLPAH